MSVNPPAPSIDNVPVLTAMVPLLPLELVLLESVPPALRAIAVAFTVTDPALPSAPGRAAVAMPVEKSVPLPSIVSVPAFTMTAPPLPLPALTLATVAPPVILTTPLSIATVPPLPLPKALLLIEPKFSTVMEVSPMTVTLPPAPVEPSPPSADMPVKKSGVALASMRMVPPRTMTAPAAPPPKVAPLMTALPVTRIAPPVTVTLPALPTPEFPIGPRKTLPPKGPSTMENMPPGTGPAMKDVLASSEIVPPDTDTDPALPIPSVSLPMTPPAVNVSAVPADTLIAPALPVAPRKTTVPMPMPMPEPLPSMVREPLAVTLTAPPAASEAVPLKMTPPPEIAMSVPLSEVGPPGPPPNPSDVTKLASTVTTPPRMKMAPAGAPLVSTEAKLPSDTGPKLVAVRLPRSAGSTPIAPAPAMLATWTVPEGAVSDAPSSATPPAAPISESCAPVGTESALPLTASVAGLAARKPNAFGAAAVSPLPVSVLALKVAPSAKRNSSAAEA